jgi:hypothetical protein
MQLSQERLSKAKRDQPLDRFWEPLRDLLEVLQATPAGVGGLIIILIVLSVFLNFFMEF